MALSLIDYQKIFLLAQGKKYYLDFYNYVGGLLLSVLDFFFHVGVQDGVLVDPVEDLLIQVIYLLREYCLGSGIIGAGFSGGEKFLPL